MSINITNWDDVSGGIGTSFFDQYFFYVDIGIFIKDYCKKEYEML